MSGQTKIAVAVGAVLIAAGVYYIGSGDKMSVDNTTAKSTESGTATGTPSNDAAAPSVALSRDLGPAAGSGSRSDGSGSTADSGSNSSEVASPAQRRIEDGAAGLPSGSASLRPQPAETGTPGATFTSTALPGERAGLSTVLSNAGSGAMGSTTASPVGDVPPNADKDAAPTAAVLPPITAVDISGSGTATTRPSTATPNVPRPADSSVKVLPPPVTPPSSLVTQSPIAKTKPDHHVIKKGDTYTSLAVEYFGSAKYAKDIEKANPGKSATRLFLGAKIVIPPPPPGATAKSAATGAVTAPVDSKTTTAAVKTPAGAKAPAGTKLVTNAGAKDKPSVAVAPPDPSRSYTVQPGEGWFDLASKFLGKGENYPRLYEYNKERVGGDPQLLRAGTVIELPPGAKLPTAPTAPSKPQPSTPPAK